MSGTLKGFLRVQEELSADIYQIVILVKEHEKRTNKIEVMSKKIKEQLKGTSLWESKGCPGWLNPRKARGRKATELFSSLVIVLFLRLIFT